MSRAAPLKGSTGSAQNVEAEPSWRIIRTDGTVDDVAILNLSEKDR